jgi:hypothetical protein
MIASLWMLLSLMARPKAPGPDSSASSKWRDKGGYVRKFQVHEGLDDKFYVQGENKKGGRYK